MTSDDSPEFPADDSPGGPLDVPTLEVMARRGASHALVSDWTFRPDSISPRRLELRLDDDQYPAAVDAARFDVRWYEGGQYTIHYVESRDGDRWQCRWDRHPKPGGPTAQFHPPPDASSAVEPSDLNGSHHLGALFGALDWATERLSTLHED
ncbi:hypothetical protein [Halosimplex marinum]|uniref:hypothetical protein n=1 Tax=Halosimplex marinum TaxID=3396620 RepID=UPI003F57D23C